MSKDAAADQLSFVFRGDDIVVWLIGNAADQEHLST
jgi:hypothetical protein